MTNVLVLGAGGQIARWVIEMLADSKDVEMTLYLRHARKLHGEPPKNAKVIEGDVLDRKVLDAAVKGQNVVYANLTGDDIDKQAKSILASMKSERRSRTAVVHYHAWHLRRSAWKVRPWNRQNIGAYLPPFRKAADAIEASGVDYTILRPAWLSDEDEIDYGTTERNEPFKGTEVSRKSVAALVVECIRKPKAFSRKNLGVNKPNTDGDKPSFYQ